MSAFQPLGNPNRLHRSGAIDFNVNYDINAANRHRYKGTRTVDAPLYGIADTLDSYSVCEGEPLFTPNPRKRKAQAITGERGPRPCLSSLNGVCVGALQDPKRKASGTPSPMEQCETIREAFFREYIPSGVAVTKWAYTQAGHQANQFVATNGGLNTIYCDEDIEVGDTVAVDLPYPENYTGTIGAACKHDGLNKASNFGFLVSQKKRGIPNDKITLVIRALPSDDGVRRSFARRGQILGTCVTAGAKGKRVDIVHTSTAIGLINTRDMHDAPYSPSDKASRAGGGGGSNIDEDLIHEAIAGQVAGLGYLGARG